MVTLTDTATSKIKELLNGQADDDVAKYGPVALYVGGTGEVRFKQVELKDLGRRSLPDEQVSNRFRMQRISDFYYGWCAAVAVFVFAQTWPAASRTTAKKGSWLGMRITIFRVDSCRIFTARPRRRNRGGRNFLPARSPPAKCRCCPL